MNKVEFLKKLEEKLTNLPEEDRNDRINFYREMIEDRIEDGFSEEDAINDIGSLDEVAKQIVANVPLKKLIKQNVKIKKDYKITEILLLVLGFPLWFPIIISLFVVLVSLYAVGWALVISLWSVFVSLVGGGLVGIVLGMVELTQGASASILGGSIACVGLGILFFFVCKGLTKLYIKFSKNIVLWIKNLFIKKEVK